MMAGPIAQRLEQSAHNRKVPGSNPGGPTKNSKEKKWLNQSGKS
jgi:hypothetical protein